MNGWKTTTVTLALAGLAGAASVLGGGGPESRRVSTPAPAPAARSAASKLGERDGLEAERRRPEQAAPGDCLVLRVSLGSRTEARGDEDSFRTSSELSVSGLLTIQLLARGEAGALHRLAWGDPALEVVQDGAPVAAPEGLVAALERGLVVRSDSAGRTLGYRFPDGGPAQARNLWRTLVDGLRFVVPGEAEERWTLEEAGGEGRLRVRYEREDPSASSILRRRAFADVGGPPRMIDGHAVGTLDELLGWPAGLECSERTSYVLPGCRAVHRLDLRCELVRREARELRAELARWDVDWDAVDGRADASRTADERERRSWELALKDVSLDELLRAGAGGVDDELATRFRSLVWKLRLEPDLAQALGRRVRTDSLPASLARLALLAAGEAGTAECQELLGGLVRDPLLAPARRADTLAALFSVPSPEPSLVDAVASALEAGELDPELQGRGLLALGALAHDARAGSGAVARLLALEHGARAQERLRLWLLALSNAGSADALPRIEACAREADPRVRACAAAALRRVEGEPARRALGVLARDEHPTVRQEAASVLARTSPDARLAELGELLAGEPEALVRRAAIHALGERARPGAEELRLLRHVQRQDPDPETRALAAALIERRYGGA
jgi:HEAT repeat protein